MDEKKKQKLLKLARIADTGELGIIEYIVELEDKLEEAIPSFNELLKRVKGDKGDKPTEKELLALITPLIPSVSDGKTPTRDELLALIKPLIPQVKDGYTPTKQDLLAIIKPLIPQISKEEISSEIYETLSEEIKSLIPSKEDIESGIEESIISKLPKFGESFRDGLELIQNEDDKLKIEAISNLRKELDSLRKSGKTDVAIGANRNLYQMLDVNVTGVTPDQSIKWDGAKWIPYTPTDLDEQTLQSVTEFGATTTVESTFSGGLITPNLKASSSAGILLESNSGTDVALLGAGGGAGATFYGGVALNTMTQGSVLFAGASGLISQDNANLFYDDTNNRLGIGTTAPSGTLDITSSGSATPLIINKASESGVRERLMTAKVSDNATTQFFINNGTIGDGAFAPVFGGYTESTTLWPMGFGGYVPSSADASDSSNFGLIDFLGSRTTNASDPLNGTLSDIVNRKLLTVRTVSKTYFTIAGSGNVGVGTTAPRGKLEVWGVAPTSQGQLNLVDSVNASTNTASLTRVAGFGNNIGTGTTGRLWMFGSASVTNHDFIITTDPAGSNILLNPAGNVGIGTSAPSATLDVGGGSILSIGTGGTAKMLVQDDVNAISGMQMSNINTGTAADFRFLIKDPTGHYFTFMQPGVNNTGGPIFGLARNTTDFIINAAGTGRNIAIGTGGGNNSLIFATNGDERMRIDTVGNVGIGTTSPNANAILDVSSTTKAFMPPRMTEAQRDAISSPTAGMVIYNSTTNVLNFHNGSAWGAV
jgi:hypothetical protein